jgi:rubrerythrin
MTATNRTEEKPMKHTNLAAPELEAIEVGGLTRSAFLVRGTLAAGAVMGTSALSPMVSRALAQSSDGDVEILNYALTLEVLEATFYDEALRKVSGLDAKTKKLATEIRDNEMEHVDTLTKTIKQLGGKPVQAPKLDFGSAFASKASFLKLANTLEDTGVSAYNGAAPQISSQDVLTAAGTIVQVEARHAAALRFRAGQPPAPAAFDRALTPTQVQAALRKLG